jgi:hypothetical protein
MRAVFFMLRVFKEMLPNRFLRQIERRPPNANYASWLRRTPLRLKPDAEEFAGVCVSDRRRSDLPGKAT